MNQSVPNEKQIFDIARGIPSPAVRSEYLKQACGDNSQLFERVVALLKTTDGGNSFLESPPEALAATAGIQTVTEKPGTVIGPYKLLQQIGEGGFGVVYMAEQLKPVKRKVALKIIKRGMDSKEVIARFEAERQALALMNHPNIAKVFDGGTTDLGGPYFVMELVKGVALTEFCDKNRLTTEQRLKLFTKVCHAIQHAHQKGVIHRDIKPSNVMVTLIDNQPVPKVIDFGVAKAISQELTEKTMFTAYGQMIGTPQYMSPEQAQMSGLDIDTRSDVYSLGVLLYELLTGKTPLDIKQLRNTAYAEMQRLICEVEPSKPSTKVSALGEASLAVAQNRGIDARKLNLLLRGDLDWIVMTALDKDRNRRYESAGNFAADIERFLDDHPIQARPPSTGYKLQKFYRRNRGKIYGWTGAALLLILAGLAVGKALNSDYLRKIETAESDDENRKITEELTRTRQQQVIDEAVDSAFDAFLNKIDFERAEQAVAAAEAAGATGAVLEILNGRLELNRDDPEKAISHFEKAINYDPQGVAPRAHLIMSKRAAGLESEAIQLGAKLNDYPPKSANDYLFMAEALADDLGWDPNQSVFPLIERSIELNDCNRVRLVRAKVYVRKMVVTGDVSLFEKAIKDIDAAATFARDERPILRYRLYAQLYAAYVNRSNGDNAQASEHYRNAEGLFRTYESRGFVIPKYVNFAYLDYPKTPESDNLAFRNLELQPGNPLPGKIGFLAIRQGENAAQRTLKALTARESKNDDLVFVIGFLAMHLGEKELALECYQRLNQLDCSLHMRINSQMIALLLREEKSLEKNCNEIAANMSQAQEGLRIYIRTLIGEASREDIVEATTEHLDLRSASLCLRGIKHLSDGDDEKGRQFLEEATQIGVPFYSEMIARSILHALDENPNWLNDIRGN